MDPLIVLVIGAASLAKWLYDNAKKSSEEERGDVNPPPRPDAPDHSRPHPLTPQAETDEEKMRRFLEALGLPQGSAPPPVPKSVPKPVAKPAQKPPALPVAKSAYKPHPRHVGHPISPSAPARREKIAPPLETGGPMPNLPKIAPINETAPSMEVASIPQMDFMPSERAIQAGGAEDQSEPKSTTTKPMRTTTAREALLEQLRTPASLRNAILLREILGSPKGLQSAQTPSIFSPL